MIEKKRTRTAGDVPTTERIGLAREVGKLLRDLLLIALVLYCLLNPPAIRGWLSQLGISRVELFGIELTPRNEREIADAVDAVTQQRDAALFERNDLIRANRQAIGELRLLSGQLPQAQEAILARTIATLGVETRNANIDLPPSASLQPTLIRGARQEVGSSGHWAVVYGGDPNLAAASDEIAWARDNGLGDPAILFRYNSYRSVARAGSVGDANGMLAIARRRRNDAYVVNLDTWCPNSVDRGQYQECR